MQRIDFSLLYLNKYEKFIYFEVVISHTYIFIEHRYLSFEDWILSSLGHSNAQHLEMGHKVAWGHQIGAIIPLS